MSEFVIEKLYETRDSYLNILKQVSFQLMMDPTDDEIKQLSQSITISEHISDNQSRLIAVVE